MPGRRASWFIAAIVCAVLLLSLSCWPGAAPDRRHVILVTIDTLRADHVGSGAAGVSLTPEIDRIALGGAKAPWALAPFPRTTQSVASILTGLHPLRHGADGLNMPLRDTVTTLAELFSAAGYETAAIASNFVLRPGTGFEQGFSLYSNTKPRWEGNSAPMISEEALAWARHREAGDRPFFLWVHYLDPHWPYTPSEEFTRELGGDARLGREIPDRVKSGSLSEGRIIFSGGEELGAEGVRVLQALYAAEIQATDQALGTLVRGLEELGVLDDSILLLTSDHGESLGAHDYWFAHGEYLYDDTLRVPFLVRAPRLVPAGRVLEGTIRLEDVLPTLCELAELSIPGGLDGISLAPWLRGDREGGPDARDTVHLTDHLLVRPENPRRPVAGRTGRWWALADGEYKLIQLPLADGGWEEELYAVRVDPSEKRNLADEAGDVAAELRGRLEQSRRELLAAHASLETEEAPAASDESRSILESLGYVGSSRPDVREGSSSATSLQEAERLTKNPAVARFCAPQPRAQAGRDKPEPGFAFGYALARRSDARPGRAKHDAREARRGWGRFAVPKTPAAFGSVALCATRTGLRPSALGLVPTEAPDWLRTKAADGAQHAVPLHREAAGSR